ncbi:MAG TPA: S53 family peptidase [Terriglobales bacterium]|nr:S53 family peptidase [Terriglobales bacterium]
MNDKKQEILAASSTRAPLAGVCQMAALVIGVAVVLVGAAQAQGKHIIANNTPPSLSQAQDLGPEDAAKSIGITVWIRSLTRTAASDKAVEELYDPGSANYHNWLTTRQLDGQAATADEAATVQNFLTAHNLAVSAVGEGNHFLKASGTVADLQNAFNVKIHQFRKNGRVFYSNTADPSVDEPAGSLVAAVGGLSESRMHAYSVRPIDPDTGAPLPAVPLNSIPNGFFFSAQCLRPPETVTFTTGGGLPTATYSGNRYGADITNTAFGTLPPCGYQPSEVQTAYGLDKLYAAGLDGTGQTVVIVDAYGSPTIQADAEAFSQLYGLPDLTSSNFTVYYPGGLPATQDTGWATETTLDVEWSHAVAPNASIALVIAPTNNDSDLQAALLFAIRHHLGNVISNSYGEAESDAPPALLKTWNRIIRMGAARGISVNFSSGDDGDSNPSGVTAGLLLFGVSTPADSPWATAVGGTSLFLNPDDSIKFQTGWGNNLTRIANALPDGSPIVPPLELGFDFGSGGGTSDFFNKPRYQDDLRGRGRKVPDISYLADPYTGAEIICDGTSCFGAPPNSGLFFAAYGGTSLASPTFSGLWAIANQKAHEPLGQAARLLYDLSERAITDIVPVGSHDNVRGTITTSAGTTFLSVKDLAQPLETRKKFYTALYNGTSTRWYVITFGTDTSLNVDEGWDNVTGLGTPNGKKFVDEVARHRRKDH